MSDDIIIGIKASDGGTINNLTGQGEKLRNTLRDAGEAASKIRVPTATAAAREGVARSQPVAAAYRAAAAQPGSGGGASDTNLSRGITGSTGASGRDFAAQAQGLGGLVHVYATFAANLFAVSAAFNALSKAADVSNMVKGLDQLGAQSGKALGTLSKQLIAVSDGALSMQQAMTATALASAGGMSNANMIRMTEVARKASLALGRDMPDSMDRLTKGIVKVQPELLDELGIMARVIPSQEAYARQLGKSVSTLTDFEKKQAFANAVLDEGEKKFGAINIDANPYSKLSASVQNLGQSFLALVNSPVGAFVSMLADNSILLGIALAGVAKVLLNQAAPGLFAYKQNLASLAVMAKKHADDTRLASNIELENQREFYRNKDVMLMDAAKQEYINTQKSSGAIADLTKKSQMDKLSQKIIGKDVRDLTKINPYELTSDQISAMKTRSDELLKSDDDLHKKQGSNLAAHLAKVTTMRADADHAADDAVITADKRDKNRSNIQKNLTADAAAMNKKFHLDDIKSNTAHIQATEGLGAAFKNMNAQLKLANQTGGIGVVTGIDAKTGKQLTEHIDKIGNISRIAQTASGSFDILKNAASSALSKISGFVGKFGEIGAIIGFVIATIDLAVNALGKNDKELAVFSKSYDTLKESGDNVARTLEAIQAKDPLERMSVASTAAIANAFMGVADSIDAVIKAGDKAKAKANWMDDLVDFAKRIYGGDIASKTRDSIVSSVSDSIDLLANNDKIGSKFKVNMMNILKIPKLDNKSMEDALKAMDPKDLPELYKKVRDSVSEANREFNNFSTTLQTFKAATDIAVKASQDFNMTIMSSDLMFKLGLSLVAVAASLQKVGEEGQSSKDALQDFLKDSAKLSLLSPDMANKLIGLSNEFTNNSVVIRENADNVAMLQKKYDDATVALNEYNKSLLGHLQLPGGKELKDKKDEANKALGEGKRFQNLSLESNQATQKTQEVKASELIAEAQYSAFQKGSKLIEISLGNVAQKIALGADRATATSLTGLQALYANMDFVKRDAVLAKEQLESAYKSYVAMQELRTAVEINSATLAVSNEPDPDKKAQLQVQLDGLKIFAEAMKAGPAAIQKLLDKALSGSNPNVAPRSRMSGPTAAEQAAGVQAGPLAGATASLASKMAQEDAKVQEAATALLYSKQVAIGAVKQKELMQESNIAKLFSDKLGMMQGLLQIQDETLYATKQEFDLKSDTKKQDADQEVITRKIMGLTNQIAEVTNAELKTKLEAQKDEETLALTNLGILQLIENQNKAYQYQIGLMNIKLAIAQREYNLDLAKDAQEALSATTLSDITQAEFQAQVSLGLLSDEYKAKKEAALAVARAALDLSIAQAIKDKEIVKIQEDANKKKVPAGSIKPDEMGYDRIANDTNRGIQKDADTAIAQAKIEKNKNQIIYDGRVKILGITETTAIKQAKESEILKDQAFAMEGLVMRTASLADAFGTVGEAVGKTTEVIAAMADQDLNYLRKKSDLQEIINAGIGKDLGSREAKDAEDAQRGLGKLEKQNTRDKLKNDEALLASSKKMFGEKTLAYKVLDNIQKISSIKTAALELKDLAFSLGILTTKVTAEGVAETEILGIKIASAPAKVGADAPAILSSFSTLGPPGYIMGAALLATLFAMAGGGDVSMVDMTGKTAAERQTKQGTGTVAGDDTAKSQSISNSLDILNATTVDGLSYYNKMVELLSGIKDGISGVAKGVYGVVGLRTGSQFGTQEGSSGYSVLGGLFGSSTEKQITDAGLKITGSFADVMANAGNSFKTYEDVLTTSTSSFLWISNTKQSLDTQTKDLDSKIQDSLSKVFNNAGQLMIAAGEKLGMSNKEVMDKLAQVDVSTLASLRGLKGKELDDALNSILSSMLDTASNALFSSLEAYNKFGEGMLETTMRVVDGMDKVNLAMTSVGKTSVGTGLQGIAVSDAMIKASGGLTNFLDSTKNFGDKFLTSAERLAPKQIALNTELNKLGFASNLTREQFKQLVLGFKVTDDASAVTYAKLQGLSGAVDELASAAEAYASSILGQEIKIYELKGSNEALNLTRQKELDAMDAALRPRQRYINALTDEIALRDKLKSAYDTTNTSLTTSIKSLQDYKTALLGGNSSTMSPEEKYAQSKAIFEQTAAAAKVKITTSSSATDIKTRDDAVANLSKASDSFLANSKVMNASGTQYAADFAAVGTAVDATSSALENQKTDVQQQLGFLDKIAVATDTTAQLLEKYLTAVGVTTIAQASATASGSVAAGIPYPKLAAGGLVSGMSLVGEQGPELADFSNPARVYSNADSKNLFNNDALIAEVKALREEVTKLREDQKEQTGHLIATTFTANARNAEAINSGNAQMLNQQDWKARSGVTVV